MIEDKMIERLLTSDNAAMVFSGMACWRSFQNAKQIEAIRAYLNAPKGKGRAAFLGIFCLATAACLLLNGCLHTGTVLSFRSIDTNGVERVQSLTTGATAVGDARLLIDRLRIVNTAHGLGFGATSVDQGTSGTNVTAVAERVGRALLGIP